MMVPQVVEFEMKRKQLQMSIFIQEHSEHKNYVTC